MMNHLDQLDWLAFRYVANELDEAERVEFESQLATDQEAREAVARVVEQTVTLSNALTEPATVASARSAWSTESSRWVMIAMGSCLVLLFVALVSRQADDISPDSKTQPAVASTAFDTVDLAYAWAESLPDTDQDESVEESLDVLWDNADEGGESLAPPSWMLAAVEGLGGDADSDLEMQE